MNGNEDIKLIGNVLGLTAEYCIQALRQSVALTDLLIAKGLLTKAEVDEELKVNQHVTSTLRRLLDKLDAS